MPGWACSAARIAVTSASSWPCNASDSTVLASQSGALHDSGGTTAHADPLSDPDDASPVSLVVLSTPLVPAVSLAPVEPSLVAVVVVASVVVLDVDAVVAVKLVVALALPLSDSPASDETSSAHAADTSKRAMSDRAEVEERSMPPRCSMNQK
jgi:hypothetical protein